VKICPTIIEILTLNKVFKVYRFQKRAFLLTVHAVTSASMQLLHHQQNKNKLECGPMPNMMAALTNIGGALGPMLQSLADAHCWSAVQ